VRVRFGRGAAAALLLAVVAACQKAPASAPPPKITQADLDKPLPSPLPDVVARVNGQPILFRNAAMASRQAAGPKGLKPEEVPAHIRDAMYKLITRELLFQEAVARGVAPDEHAIEQAFNEARLPHKDDAAFAAALATQGMDEQKFRQELRVQYTVTALLDARAAALGNQVSEQEARTYYNDHQDKFNSGERLRCRHILFRFAPDTPPPRKLELKTRAEGVLAQIRKGADFGALARQYSDDPGSKDKGGELKPFAKGQMPKALEDAAMALKPGQVSGVVESPYGFHIVRLEERMPAIQYPFEQFRTQITQQILVERRSRDLEALLAALRGKARIETYL